MNNNLIDFSKFTSDKQTGIDMEAAKKYFVREILPNVGEASLLRLIQADLAGDPHQVQVEMMRMFVESELMRTTPSDTSSLNQFFFKVDENQVGSKISQ